jgi:hypothetical protein
MALFSLALFSNSNGNKKTDDTRRNLTLTNAYANIPAYIFNDASWYFNAEVVCKRNLEKLNVGESYQVGYKRDQQQYLIFTKTGDAPHDQEPVPVIIIDKAYELSTAIKRTPSLHKMEGATSPRLDTQKEVEKPINYQMLCNKCIYKCVAWFSDLVNPKPILPTHK